MRVRVHETGRKRRVAEINHLRIGWNLHVASDVRDHIALHKHDRVAHQRFRFPIEKPRRFERDDVIGGERNRRERKEKREGESQKTKRIHSAHIELAPRKSSAGVCDYTEQFSDTQRR